MPRLLIIADDFTGALDTGVQFAACGIPTRVVVETAADMIRCECTVLVVDTETRHLSAEAAGKIVEVLARRAHDGPGLWCTLGLGTVWAFLTGRPKIFAPPLDKQGMVFYN